MVVGRAGQRPGQTRGAGAFGVGAALPDTGVGQLSTETVPVHDGQHVVQVHGQRRVLARNERDQLLERRPARALVALDQTGETRLGRVLVLLDERLVVHQPTFAPFGQLDGERVYNVYYFHFSYQLRNLSFSL